MFPVYLLALALLRAPLPVASPDGFSRLKSLVGAWEAKTENGATIHVSYRLISNDSALVQSFVTPSGKETLTVFHPDGAQLVATHYCAQGNQPRLVLDRTPTKDRFLFRFLDAMNLSLPTAAHLVRLEIRLGSSTEYTEVETYEEDGKPDVTTLRFHRIRP